MLQAAGRNARLPALHTGTNTPFYVEVKKPEQSKGGYRRYEKAKVSRRVPRQTALF